MPIGKFISTREKIAFAIVTPRLIVSRSYIETTFLKSLFPAWPTSQAVGFLEKVEIV